MAQSPQLLADNTFVNGLITEATGLNFPQAAVTETYDCEFDADGSVYRRNGFNFERDFDTKTIDREDKVITTYLWENVSGNGDVSLVVTQIGDTLYFYEIANTGIISSGAQTTTVTLTGVGGAPLVETVEAQYTDGNGFLFVTHPYIDPIRISYDIDTKVATPTVITIKIRDFEGSVDDPYAVDFRPTTDLASMNVDHHYNLLNQGWTTVGLTGWDTAQTTMPSNADVMWRFKNASNVLDFTNATVANVVAGNTPAPKGHFILDLANQDRDAASGLTGVDPTTTLFYRPSTAAFFAGRMFYAGINLSGFNSNIYFSQIVERDEQYGNCYQINDPTSEDLFDLLPSDGGVISIPEAGTVYKLMTVPGGLCVFASKGVWFITGSTGLGFTAVDYTVQKIADIPTLTHTSFVNVSGFPCWWNADGIYVIQVDGNSIPTVQNLTNDKIKTFYDRIPISSKRFAKGFFHRTDQHIRWLYRSAGTTNVDDLYEYDRILNFNIRTGAFYPWTISDSPVKVHSIVSTSTITRPISVDDVALNNLTDLVVDSLGNQVITFSEAGSDSLQFDKYLVSYPEDGSFEFTFAERDVDSYVDWLDFDDVGVNYDSYFITGYKLPGTGIRTFQNNYVKVFSRTDEPVSYRFQALWDYAVTGSGTGEWSSSQLLTQSVSHHNTSYSVGMKKLKVRGRGSALQFRVASVAGAPFDIIGWSGVQVINQGP